MSSPTVWEVAKCLFRRMRYMNRRAAYYQATAENLERAAVAVVSASESIIEQSKREQIKNKAQRARIVKTTDMLTKLLAETKNYNAHPRENGG